MVNPLKEKSIPWTRIAVEMTAIVFSVLLALVLDDWRQSRDEKQVVAAVLLSLQTELERNQRVLEVRLPYHEALLDTLESKLQEFGVAESGAGTPERRLAALKDLGFDGGIGASAMLSRGAWEAARASGAMTRIGIGELFLLSNAYGAEEHLARAMERLGERHDRYLQAVMMGGPPEAVLIDFASGLSDVLAQEANLCDTYRILGQRLSNTDLQGGGRCGSGHIQIS